MGQANIDVTVSLMRPDELNFVASSWKRSHADAPQNSGIPSPKFYARMNRLFDEVLARPNVEVLVAHDPDQPRVILGYVCIEEQGPVLALHYAYTRHSHWRLGVCSELLRHALQGAAEADTLVYTAGSRFDGVWERWGFRRVDLNDWLRDAGRSVKGVTKPDSGSGKVRKHVKTGGVR